MIKLHLIIPAVYPVAAGAAVVVVMVVTIVISSRTRIVVEIGGITIGRSSMIVTAVGNFLAGEVENRAQWRRFWRKDQARSLLRR